MEPTDFVLLAMLYYMFSELGTARRYRQIFSISASTLVSADFYTAAVVRREHVRIPLFYERWISLYLESDFFTHFRMTRTTMKTLVELLGPLHIRSHSGGYEPVPLEKAVLITVWYLAKGEGFLSISDRFNVALSTTHKCVTYVLEYIASQKHQLIMWPTCAEAATIAEDFFSIAGYPDVIGAIDGTHIPIKPPREQHDSYLNRKFVHTIVLQGVCTSKKFFTNVFIGHPGSVHDARVLRESGITRKIERDSIESLFYGSYHLIGDSAYPCHTWLMTPYRDTGRLTLGQRNHNLVLSKTRVVIENSFGLLKGRWRILQFINANSIPRAVQIATVCCVLHNFCLLENDFFTEESDDIFPPPETERDISPVRLEASNKRDEIADFLMDAARIKRQRLS